MSLKFILPAFAAFCFSSCQLNEVTCDADCQQEWLDGSTRNDSADLLSKKIPNPDSAYLEKPVLIAGHGFTATSYEWEEFHRFVDDSSKDSSVLVSRILMGGHGADIGDFEKTSWQDWGKPILDEYTALVQKGYKHISLIGSSTSGTLMLQYVHDHAFEVSHNGSVRSPEHLFLIDPFIVPRVKLMTLVKIIGPILGNSPNDLDSGEKAHWYTNRPADQIEQLYDLATKVKEELEDGFKMPVGTRCKIWKSDGDQTADPVGALLIYKGVRHSDGNRIAVDMVKSDLHVFTRLQGRNTYTPADSDLQQKTFKEIIALLLKG